MKRECEICSRFDQLPFLKRQRLELLNHVPYLCQLCREDDENGLYGLHKDKEGYFYTGLLFKECPGFLFQSNGDVIKVSTTPGTVNKMQMDFNNHFKAEVVTSSNPILRYFAGTCIKKYFPVQDNYFKGIFFIRNITKPDDAHLEIRYFDGDIERWTILEFLLKIELNSLQLVPENAKEKHDFFNQVRVIFNDFNGYIALPNSFRGLLSVPGKYEALEYRHSFNVFDLDGMFVENVLTSRTFDLRSHIFETTANHIFYRDFSGRIFTVFRTYYNYYYPTQTEDQDFDHISKLHHMFQSGVFSKDETVKTYDVSKFAYKIKKHEELSKLLKINNWFDPFCGNQSLLKAFRKHLISDYSRFYTNDIDTAKKADYHFDALNYRNYELVDCANVICSPPKHLVEFAIGLFVKIFDVIVVHHDRETHSPSDAYMFYNKLLKHSEVYNVKVSPENAFTVILRTDCLKFRSIKSIGYPSKNK